MHPEFISLTSDLITIPSTALRPHERDRCAEALCAWMDANTISYQSIRRNGVVSLLVGNPQKKAPVTILAHYDVVEGPDQVFRPFSRDGRLYGRGSSDDKYACAMGLLLYRDHLNELRSQGKDQNDMPFMLLFTGDEEVGGHDGAEFLASQISTELCIALDSSPASQLTIRQKGYLRLKLASTGKSAHGAAPWNGINAITALARDCIAVENLFTSFLPADPEKRAAHWHPTCNIGIISGGGSVNQVPDAAEAKLDIRYTESDDADAIIAAIQKAISGTVSEESARGMPVFAGDSPWLERFSRHIPGVRHGSTHGTCDTRHFSPYGIACVAWGPDNNSSQHTDDEHLELESAAFVHNCLDAFLRDIRN